MDQKLKMETVKVIVTASLMSAATVGVCFYSSSVFYQEFSSAFGISIGSASLTTMWFLLFMGLGALAVPWLLKHVKFHIIVHAGTVLMLTGIFGLAFSLNSLMLNIFSAIEGIGASMIGLVPAVTLINNWFDKKMSWAASIAMAASALAAALFTPLLTIANAVYGWRMGIVVQGILVLVLLLPLLTWRVALTPEAAGIQGIHRRQETSLQAEKTPAVVLACFGAIAVISSMLIGLPMHFSSYAASLQSGALTGATMLSFAMAGNILFKLLGGFLCGKIKPVLTMGLLDLFALIGTAGLLICAITAKGAGLHALAFLVGSVYAISELSIPLMVSSRFAAVHFTSVYALMNALAFAAAGLSIPAVGYLYDSTGSYVWAYSLGVAAEVIIGLLAVYLVYNEKADGVVMSPAARGIITKARQAAKEKAARKKAEKAAAASADELMQDVRPSAAVSNSVLKHQLNLVDDAPAASAAPDQKKNEAAQASTPAEPAEQQLAAEAVPFEEEADQVEGQIESAESGSAAETSETEK